MNTFDVLQRVIAAQEEERGRIARELHDQAGQYLTALRYGVTRIQELLKESQIETDLGGHCRTIIEELDLETHHLVMLLRPPALDIGLVSAVLNFTLAWSERTHIPVDFFTPEKALPKLPKETEIAIYRIVQEALTNIWKHAKAKRVSIILKAQRKMLHLVIEDDGAGFQQVDKLSTGESFGGYGLIGMKERAMLAGGSFTVESTLGKGTTIFVRIPIEKKARGEKG